MAAVSVSRAAASFPELTGRQLLTHFSDRSVPFSSTMSLRWVTASGLGSSRGCAIAAGPGSPWFPRFARFLRYGAMCHQTGFLVALQGRYKLYKINHSKVNQPSTQSSKPPNSKFPLPTTPTPPASEPSTEKQDAGCMAHIIFMALDWK